jgi:3-oxoacyl-[acyl-carrier-protein] synthase-3
MLFGDAGTATLLDWTDEKNPAWFDTGTRGSGWDQLIAPAGGYDLPIREDIASLEITDETGNVWHLWDDIMKGMGVFKFTTDVGPKGIARILEFAGKTQDDIDYFAFHQANKQIVRTVAGYAGLPKDKFSTETFTQYGNCSSASVTTDICRRLHEAPAKTLCLVTFGVGLSWGFAVLDFGGAYAGGIRDYKTPSDKPTREEKIKHWIAHFKGASDA